MKIFKAIIKRLTNGKCTLTTKFKNLRLFQIRGTEEEWKLLLFYNEMLEKVEEKTGDIAEFGVGGGNSLITLSRILEIREKGRNAKEKRKIYGFDSFEGLPSLNRLDYSPSAKDNNMKRGGFHEPAAYKDLFNFVSKRDNLFLIKGWFNKTIPRFFKKNPHTALALIHIDCDLYDSTKIVLEQTWDHLLPSGIIVFDELFHKDFPGESIAFKEFMKNKKYSIHKSRIKPDKKYIIKLK